MFCLCPAAIRQRALLTSICWMSGVRYETCFCRDSERIWNLKNSLRYAYVGSIRNSVTQALTSVQYILWVGLTFHQCILVENNTIQFELALHMLHEHCIQTASTAC